MANTYETVSDMPHFQLNNGQRIPGIGLGTWKGKEGVVEDAVKIALRLGYRHIDCAAVYKNQPSVGNALHEIFQDGKIDRKDVHITSKLWNTEHAADRVKPALQQTLKDLQLDYIDEYLIHWPVTGNEGPTLQPPIKETWQAMEKLVDDGLAKSIGVSNFTVEKLQDLLSYARIPAAVNQVEMHPYFRNQKVLDFCKSKGIHVTAYSPLGSPDSASMFDKEDAPSVLKDPVVTGIAEKLGKQPAQVLVRWVLQRGVSVIPKASSEDHARSNLEALNFELPEEDMQALSTLKKQLRMVDGADWLKEQGPYKTVRDLWDGDVPEENPDSESVKASEA